MKFVVDLFLILHFVLMKFVVDLFIFLCFGFRFVYFVYFGFGRKLMKFGFGRDLDLDLMKFV
ncbi:hypothetical protein LguiA_003058 [Lonicera macranthoides]